jgi:hypothetical protein
MYKIVNRETGENLGKRSELEILIEWVNSQKETPEKLGFSFKAENQDQWQRIDHHFIN